MYKVRVERKAQKQLAKISEPYYTKIKSAILGLAKNPNPPVCKQLKGRQSYRIRVGQYRIIYEIRQEVLQIDVIAVGHRKDFYR